uniref:Uncharacterized protein n=1 Tax=Manihot esculenta TaxID=3983 RepID=A0A2C9U1T3_MANES
MDRALPPLHPFGHGVAWHAGIKLGDLFLGDGGSSLSSVSFFISLLVFLISDLVFGFVDGHAAFKLTSGSSRFGLTLLRRLFFFWVLCY